MPWMLAAMAIPSLVSVGLNLWGQHKSSEEQKAMAQQSTQSNADYMKMMAPYMQSSQQALQAAQASAFGMAGATGINTADIFKQLQGGMAPGQTAGAPGAGSGPGAYPGMMPGYTPQQQQTV